jgi:phage terminase large subunit-like protein
MNLLEPDGRCWCLFTPWHRDDLNADLKRNRHFATFRRAVEQVANLFEYKSIWPARWPSDKLRERKEEIGAASFARGYRLVPLTEETAPIKAEWIRYWTAKPHGEALQTVGLSGVNLLADPLGSQSLTQGLEFERIILAIDPAVSTDPSADASALVVLGAIHGAHDRINEIRCLDAIACRVRLPQLIERIEALDRKWNPQVILFESNAAFAGIRDLMTRHAGFGPKIKQIVQSKSKALRVEAFSVPVENGIFRLLGCPSSIVHRPSPIDNGRWTIDNGRLPDPSQQALYDEMTTFPVGEHDDLLDAAAMGTEYLLNTREPRVW